MAASNAFSSNFANDDHRNSIKPSNLCAMCWKAISKITFNIRLNLKLIWHSWHTWVSKGNIKGFWEQWGLSDLIGEIRLGLGAWPGVGGIFLHGHPSQVNSVDSGVVWVMGLFSLWFPKVSLSCFTGLQLHGVNDECCWGLSVVFVVDSAFVLFVSFGLCLRKIFVSKCKILTLCAGYINAMGLFSTSWAHAPRAESAAMAQVTLVLYDSFVWWYKKHIFSKLCRHYDWVFVKQTLGLPLGAMLVVKACSTAHFAVCSVKDSWSGLNCWELVTVCGISVILIASHREQCRLWRQVGPPQK